MGMGFDNCEVGFGKKMNWEMGLVPPFRILVCDIERTREGRKRKERAHNRPPLKNVYITSSNVGAEISLICCATKDALEFKNYFILYPEKRVVIKGLCC